MNTTIYFRWNQGVEVMWLLETVRSFADKHGLEAKSLSSLPGLYNMKYLIDGSPVLFQTHLPQETFKFDPSKCRKISWYLTRCPNVDPWALMVIARDDFDDPARDGFIRDRVKTFRMFINEDMTPWRLKRFPEFLDGAIEKYHLVKDLFSAWNCDVAEATCRNYNEIYEGDPDPQFEARLFRFAKEGRKVLHLPLEQRRMVTNEEIEDGSWRRVVDE